MSVAQPERVTQNGVIELFRRQLGYAYLGNWQDRPKNSNLEADLLQQSALVDLSQSQDRNNT